LVEVCGGRVDAGFEGRQFAVADLGCAAEVAVALVTLGLSSFRLERFLQFSNRGDRLFFGGPSALHRIGLLAQVGEFFVELRESLHRCLVGLLGECETFNFELADAPLDDVDLRRHRVDLDAQPRRGFVDEIDRLVGKESPGDVTTRQHRRAHQRGVLDPHAVVNLVALLEAAQDRHGVFDGRFADVDLLEAALEGGVLFDVLTELIKGRGADHAKFAAGEHRLDHVAGVHRAFSRAGADDGVQLVDEGDDLATRVGDFLQHRLEALLELTAVLRAGDHRAEVEGQHALVLEAFGNVALDDAVREAFDDGGLADARFADEHRIVLRASREHLDHAADLLIAADDWVELSATGVFGQVATVLFERLEGLLRILARDAVAASHFLERGEQVVAADPDALVQRQKDMLDREVLVTERAALAVGAFERLAEGPAHLRVGTAIGLGELGEHFVDLVAQAERGHANTLEHREHDGALLGQHRGEEVIRRDLRVVAGSRRPDGGLEGLLSLQRPAVGIERHGEPTSLTGKLIVTLSTLVRAVGFPPR